MDLSNIKLIVSEVDGVITNGVDSIDTMNNTLFKAFYSADFEIINKLKKYFTFVFLSADPSISYGVMRTRNIPFYFTKPKEKKIDVLKQIIYRYNATPENVMYIGSKLSDVDCMKLAEVSICTFNSLGEISSLSNYVTDSVGGDGVIGEVYELLLHNKSNLNSWHLILFVLYVLLLII